MFTYPINQLISSVSFVTNPGNYKPTANFTTGTAFTNPANAYDTTNYPDTTTSSVGTTTSALRSKNHTFNGFASANSINPTLSIRHNYQVGGGADQPGYLIVTIYNGATVVGSFEVDGPYTNNATTSSGGYVVTNIGTTYTGNISALSIEFDTNTGLNDDASPTYTTYILSDMYFVVT